MNEDNKQRATAAGRLGLLLKSPCTPFVLLAAFLLVRHISLPIGLNDDAFYASHAATYGLLPMVRQLYENWSSRVIIEFLGLLIMSLPGFVWRVANPLIITGLLYGIAVVGGFSKQRGANALLCCLMLAYDWAILCSAGWVMTTVFTVWPAAAAMPALVCLRAAMLRSAALAPAAGGGPGGAIGPTAGAASAAPADGWATVGASLSLLPLLVAVNTEQVVVILLLLFGCCLAYCLARRLRVPPLLLVYLAVTIAGLVFILTTPGGRQRTGNSIASFFSHYPMRSLLQNAELGISKALADIYFKVNLPFTCFFALCAWAVWRQNRKIVYTLVALAPLGANLVFGVFRSVSFALVPRLSFFTNALTNDGIIRVENAWRLASVLPFVLLCLCFGCSIVSLYLAFGHSRAAFWAISCFVIGFCGSAMLGFSPSIWGSADRTGLYFTLVAMALCGALYHTAVRGRAERAVALGGAGALALRGAVLLALM